MNNGMTIGKLAKRAGVTTDAIRFYEAEGIVLPAARTAAGYRLYGDDALRRLNFIRQAQCCGMTLSEIQQLLSLKTSSCSRCGDIRAFAERKKQQLDQTIKSMMAMSQVLDELIETCTTETRPTEDCPILAALDRRSIGHGNLSATD